MRKKYYYLFIIFLVVSFVFSPVILNVKASGGASQQPAVCGGPSKTMSMYFDFQDEIKSILFGSSNINERLFNVTNSNKGLFGSKVLELSPMDALAYNVLSSLGSAISTTSTSVVLLLLASTSVVQSNAIDGFVILFKDRPVVRDYKYMLDIETELFDIAYFRSKQINLTRPFDSDDLMKDLLKIIEKYQDLGLFEKTGRKPSSNISMADLLFDLLDMNSAMRNFIVYRGDGILSDYNGCLGVVDNKVCDEKVAVLRFDPKAIAQLDEDYKGIGAFGACNLYASNFKSTISKSANNNLSSVKVAMQDVGDAWIRLWEATVGGVGKGRWKLLTDPCNMSDYEMAQLRAYWGGNWECGEGIGASTIYPKTKKGISSVYGKVKKGVSYVKEKISNIVSVIQEYLREKKVERELRKQQKTLFENKYGVPTKKEDVGKELQEASTTQERQQVMTDNYGEGVVFNPNFSYDILGDFLLIYTGTMVDYKQSQEAASESDFSYELKKIRGLLDQVDTVINQSKLVEDDLQKIADYHCNG